MENLLNISFLALPLLGFLFLALGLTVSYSKNSREKSLHRLWIQLSSAIFLLLASYVGLVYYSYSNPAAHETISQALLYFSIGVFLLFTAFSIVKLRQAIKTNSATNQAEVEPTPAVTYDYLTQLKNCAALTDELNSTIEKAKRGSTSSSMLFIDIDNFKQFNTDYGHACGDYLLTKIAEIFKKRTRKTDIVARYSGDEFVIILYNASMDQATHLAQMLIMKLSNTELIYKNNSFTISCSIGVAPITANSIDAQSVIATAQEALESGRTQGNSQVRVSNSTF